MPILPTIDLPPPRSWDEFELLVAELCIREWRTANVTRYGRQGQAQQGVDIFGYPEDDKSRLTCVQCKRVSEIDMRVVEAEVDKALAFKPTPRVYIIATTAPSDARLQQEIREAEGRWPFLVYLRSWDDIQRSCTRYPDLVEQFWPSLSGLRMSTARVRDTILDSQPEWFQRVFGEGSEMRFVYKFDVNLAIVVPDEFGTEFEEDWIKVFPTHAVHPKPARMVDVSVVYAGQKLASFTFVSLDGARYLLPLPAAPANEVRVIDEMQAALGRIVGKGFQDGFEAGTKRTQMSIVRAHPGSQLEWVRDEEADRPK